MQLSVVILNYNVCQFLLLCLQSIERSLQGIDAEIIVVDNNSSDNSVVMVKTCFPKVIVIENKDNVGFAKANNQAVAIAKGEYVCLLNPDTVVPETTFVNVLQKAKILPSLGILGVQLIDGKGRYLPEPKRNLQSPKVSFCKILGEKFYKYAPYYADHINAEGEGEVTVLVGAFMLLKTKLYKQVNGFDERYFMYGEDIDLSYTIKKLGYKNYYYGSEKVIHFKGESTFKDKEYRRRFYGAMKLFYKKHFKNSFITNGIFMLGIKATSLVSRLPKDLLGIAFKKAVLLSSDTELARRIEQKMGVSTSLTTVNNVYGNTCVKKPELCFLDMSQMSYSQAILLIHSNSNSMYYFRFVSENNTVALGSDTSLGRGQVISL